MGYTHYWRRPTELPAKPFERAVTDCRKLLPQLGIPLAGGDGTGTPEFDSDAHAFNGAALVFNGVGEESYETFDLSRIVDNPRNEPMVFCFCKTDQKPYDLVVQAALIVFKHHLHKKLQVSSDGDAAAWDAARQVCQQHLKYGGDFKLDS